MINDHYNDPVMMSIDAIIIRHALWLLPHPMIINTLLDLP